MLLKILLIALIVYVIVVTRARVRLPHPGLQATVDVLQAATLRDEHVVATARRFVEYADAQQPALPAGDPYAERLERLTSRYAAVNGVPLNFRVYRTPQVNAFATADGSIRIYSGLMDRMSDDELMAIVGHEMGHIRNSDSLGAMRKACLTSAIRNTLEPKIVGKQIGLHPLATLVAMFVGLELLGLVGLVGFPVTLAILANLEKNGMIRLFREKKG